jgi:hypothetical protein
VTIGCGSKPLPIDCGDALARKGRVGHESTAGDSGLVGTGPLPHVVHTISPQVPAGRNLGPAAGVDEKRGRRGWDRRGGFRP